MTAPFGGLPPDPAIHGIWRAYYLLVITQTMYKILACFTLGSFAAFAALPNGNALMARSVKTTELNWAAAPNYAFLETDIKSRHGSEPTKKTSEVMMIDGSPYERTIALNGQPLSPAQQRAEESKLQKETAIRLHESSRARRKRIAAYMADRERDHAMLNELSRAFDYTVVGEDRKDSRRVWVLRGVPKPGYTPANRETKVMAGMVVNFWIDQNTYQWVRVEAEVKKPVSIYGLAKVGVGTKFILEQEPISPNLWLPKRFQVDVRASALGFLNEDSNREEIYTDYRPRISTASETQEHRNLAGSAAR